MICGAWRSTFIGLISAWLPSPRSTEHQIGALEMMLDGHCRFGEVNPRVRPVEIEGHLGRLDRGGGHRRGSLAVWLGPWAVRLARAGGSSGVAGRRARGENQIDLPGRVAQEVEASAHMGGARPFEKKSPQDGLHGHTISSMACGSDEVKDPLAGPVKGSPGVPDRPGPDADKAQWRRWALARRRQVEPIERARRSAAVRTALAAWLAERPPATVLLRSASGRRARSRRWPPAPAHRTVGPPPAPIERTPHRAISWDSPRERHRFGFEQPMATAVELAPASIGVALVPARVRPVRGPHRHGSGTMTGCSASPPVRSASGWWKPLRWSSGCLGVTAVDVPMDLLVTEEGVRPVLRPMV